MWRFVHRMSETWRLRDQPRDHVMEVTPNVFLDKISKEVFFFPVTECAAVKNKRPHTFNFNRFLTKILC